MNDIKMKSPYLLLFEASDETKVLQLPYREDQKAAAVKTAESVSNDLQISVRLVKMVGRELHDVM
jgi:hypothetical protein